MCAASVCVVLERRQGRKRFWSDSLSVQCVYEAQALSASLYPMGQPITISLSIH